MSTNAGRRMARERVVARRAGEEDARGTRRCVGGIVATGFTLEVGGCLEDIERRVEARGVYGGARWAS